jgi:hypothetical protein
MAYKQQKFNSHTLDIEKSKIKILEELVFSECPLSGSKTTIFSYFLSIFCSSPFLGLYLHVLPKVSSNTIILGLGFQPMNIVKE